MSRIATSMISGLALMGAGFVILSPAAQAEARTSGSVPSRLPPAAAYGAFDSYSAPAFRNTPNGWMNSS